MDLYQNRIRMMITMGVRMVARKVQEDVALEGATVCFDQNQFLRHRTLIICIGTDLG
jgi:hypothetical protein